MVPWIFEKWIPPSRPSLHLWTRLASSASCLSSFERCLACVCLTLRHVPLAHLRDRHELWRWVLPLRLLVHPACNPRDTIATCFVAIVWPMYTHIPPPPVPTLDPPAIQRLARMNPQSQPWRPAIMDEKGCRSLWFGMARHECLEQSRIHEAISGAACVVRMCVETRTVRDDAILALILMARRSVSRTTTTSRKYGVITADGDAVKATVASKRQDAPWAASLKEWEAP